MKEDIEITEEEACERVERCFQEFRAFAESVDVDKMRALFPEVSECVKGAGLALFRNYLFKPGLTQENVEIIASILEGVFYKGAEAGQKRQKKLN